MFFNVALVFLSPPRLALLDGEHRQLRTNQGKGLALEDDHPS
jgi:hypothetical protein